MDAPKLEWMYKNSNDLVDKEEYLLGKPIDKAFEQSQSSFTNEIEKDCLPTSIFANTGSNIQVDVLRKLKEDPLEVIRQKEIERRKQLLKNPVKLKKLQNLLKGQGDDESIEKKPKKKKKRDDKDSSDIDKLLASKYMKIMKKHGIKSLSELSDIKLDIKKKSKKREKESKYSSSSNSDSEENIKKNKYYKKRKEYKKSSNSDSSDSEKKNYKKISHSKHEKYSYQTTRRSEQSLSPSSKSEKARHLNKGKSEFTDKRYSRQNMSRDYKSGDHSKYFGKKNKNSTSISENEKQKRLQEMMENAKWRDEVRAKNIDRYKKEEAAERTENYNEDFLRKQIALAMSSTDGSVESRIKSNINNIQKSKFSMNENFVRR